MRTLIGALLAVTALSPTLASAQGLRVGAEAQLGPDDGPRDAGPDRRRAGRDDRQRPAPIGGDRPDRNDDRRGPAHDAGRPPVTDGERDGERPGRARLGQGPGDRWTDRDGPRVGPRGGDRDGPRGGDRPDAGGYRDDRSDRRRAANDWTRARVDARDDRRARYGFADRAAWNRGWRGDDRYDWSGYRTANRGAYRLPRYYAPGGSGYRRVAIGIGLQASLWNRRYWIDDPYAYRLPQAYGPYRWVRYYDDALLVDLNGGRVVDAVYGIFW